ncbi:general transcription factor 3C polypeptide 2-like isoform X2 [Lytechinus pictus]|uniref:general transcription factor 3C polypeptide 2-like isoform X2 n=1 Tax=Lytechinus pictus TaxID=7653 RepID=UPI0030B9B3C6
MEKKNADSSFGQCLCLDWQQRKPHFKLAAGFSSGAIAIWNIGFQSSFLVRQSKIDDSITLHPIQVFTAHNGPVLTISFSPADNSFMCSSSRNRMMEFWDIHQPGIPICSRLFRNPPQTCQWLSQYNAVLTKEDVSLPRIVLQEGSTANNPAAQIFSQQCHVTDVAYSEWLNCLAVTDNSGKIEICKMSKQWPGNHKVKLKLQWSPNKASCKWFLAGGKSGIVHLYHLPSKFIESR